MTPSEMRAEVFERDNYRCQFPHCTLLLTEVNPLQLAHLKHRGMGGAPDRNTVDNGLALCREDHDWLDGRLGRKETICRTRTAFAAYRQAHRSRKGNRPSTRPQTATESGDGRSAPTRTSKPSNTESMETESPQPRTSTTKTTTRSTTDPKTWPPSQPSSTSSITLGTERPSTTPPHGPNTKTATARLKSEKSSESIQPPSPGDSEQWGTSSDPSVKDRRSLPDVASTPNESERCTWPDCVLPGSLPSSDQLEKWSAPSSETSGLNHILPEDLLCEIHSGLLDGRMGSGARLERETILRAVVGL